MQFMGAETYPNARASAFSSISQELLRPRVPFVAYSGSGAFQQNFFTYTDAAVKLVPKAVEYSAGLIDYFFRGELRTAEPENNLYAMLDGGDPASTCKDNCGFKKLKVRVYNSTPALTNAATNVSIPQAAGAGTLVAVVKFSRNSCYQSDWSGDPGDLNPGFDDVACLLPLRGGDNGTTPIPLEEQVVSAPLIITSLPA
jgi:hypothetical protein